MSKQYKSDRLHEVLLNDLAENAWHAGERFYSEHQLCIKYDVSRQTVRKGTNALADQGLLKRVKGSGTYVTEKAVSLRHTKTHSIGVLVTYLSDYIFPVVIKELERTFTGAGYTVQLASSSNSSARERTLIQKMLDSEVDGIILEPTKSALPNPNMDIYEALAREGFPLITIHSSYPGVNLPSITVDDTEAGYLATKHLLRLGHRHISAVLKSDDLQGLNRYKGILKAHRELNLNFNDQRVYWYTTEDLGHFEALNEAILKRLTSSTAVVVYNDQIGIMVQRMLLDAGLRIPQDCSMVSIDDSKFARLAPVPLTSVRSPSAEIARTAADQLLELISGVNFKPGKVFKPCLTTRESSAAAVMQPTRLISHGAESLIRGLEHPEGSVAVTERQSRQSSLQI